MTQTKTVWAEGIRGKKGDIILRLEDGKIGLPRDFTPREREWHLVEIVEDRQRYAIVRLHRHVESATGMCLACRRVVDKNKLEKFVEQWINNMLRKESIKQIQEIKSFVLGRFWELTVELGDMIYRLERERERRMVGEYVCPPGYGVVDSCFVYRCRDRYCEQLSYIIEYLRYIKNEVLEFRYQRARRILEPDKIITVYTLGIETISVV
jgi:hypothetical protein